VGTTLKQFFGVERGLL